MAFGGGIVRVSTQVGCEVMSEERVCIDGGVSRQPGIDGGEEMTREVSCTRVPGNQKFGCHVPLRNYKRHSYVRAIRILACVNGAMQNEGLDCTQDELSPRSHKLVR
jgi:hypothetical protein